MKRLYWVLAVVLSGVAGAARPVLAYDYYVTTYSDYSDPSKSYSRDKKSDGSAYSGSLRDVILNQACKNDGDDRIRFKNCYSGKIIALDDPIVIPDSCRGAVEIHNDIAAEGCGSFIDTTLTVQPFKSDSIQTTESLIEIQTTPGAATPSHIGIYGLTFKNSPGAAIRIGGDASGTVIQYNTFANNHSDVVLSGSGTGNVISGNYFGALAGSGGQHIDIVAGTSEGTVTPAEGAVSPGTGPNQSVRYPHDIRAVVNNGLLKIYGSFDAAQNNPDGNNGVIEVYKKVGGTADRGGGNFYVQFPVGTGPQFAASFAATYECPYSNDPDLAALCDFMDQLIVHEGDVVTFLGIDRNNNTSEFARIMTVLPDSDNDGYADAAASAKDIDHDGVLDQPLDCAGQDNNPHSNPSIDHDCDGYSSVSYGGEDCDDNDPKLTPETDADCDGHVTQDKDGDDCDDQDKNVYAGAPELCDGVDNDCDQKIDEALKQYTHYHDKDHDSYGNPYDYIENCSQKSPVEYTRLIGRYTTPQGQTLNYSDCNDTSPWIHPRANETCNGLDDDCDGVKDEGNICATTEYYPDQDGDGYGDVNGTPATTPSDGYVPNNLDCNDSDNTINPLATEVCDSKDNNCDGQVDEGLPTTTFYRDGDSDTYGNSSITQTACAAPTGYIARAGDCDDTNSTVNPGVQELCGDDVDNNCDGQTDNNCGSSDDDGDGYTVAEGDCNDQDSSIHPGVAETCDGKDNDCNGTIDDDLSQTTFYQDADGDMYGNPQVFKAACAAPTGYVNNGADCDDTNPSVHPLAMERCNTIDDDCDGTVNDLTCDATDDDGDGSSESQGDCDDKDATTYPGATEICDNKDNNCEGTVDEGAKTAFYPDGDGDGYGTNGQTTQACSAPAGYAATNTDCDDTNANVNPGKTEVANNGLDDDCNGGDLAYVDSDGDGVSGTQGDCDDTDKTVYPGAAETCDSKDNNCDGTVDEGVTATYYADLDGDSYGQADKSLTACQLPSGYVTNTLDCDDTLSTVYPGQKEVCDALDNDCNGETDEGLPDCQGGVIVSPPVEDEDSDGVTTDQGDCNDHDNTIYPGAPEDSDGKDNDCNGVIDDVPSSSEGDPPPESAITGGTGLNGGCSLVM